MELSPLEDQIKNRCIHFNGVSNKYCDKGIPYENVWTWSPDHNSDELPCLKNDKYAQYKCAEASFPSDEEVAREVRDTNQRIKFIIYGHQEILAHYSKTGQTEGEIECPNCKGSLNYIFNELNKHIYGRCESCDMGFME